MALDEKKQGLCLIVGLGNPGKEYESSRHNVGFYLLDGLAASQQASWGFDKHWNAYKTSVVFYGRRLWLLKPQTFMNLSGSSVQAAGQFFKLRNEQIMVVCDDVSMPFGATKVSEVPGTAGHKGVESLLLALGEGVVRYRVGVGAKPSKQMDLKDFVLSSFNEEEKSFLPLLLQRFIKNVEVLVDKGVIKGMNYIER